MLDALGWGALAASSLVIGALLAFARDWPSRQIGFVLSFGAGALISAVSFELAGEGVEVGSLASTAIGLGTGALTYYLLDGVIAKREQSGNTKVSRAKASNAGKALALGAFLDGIPEQAVLGLGLAAGEGVSVGLIVAIFVSNLPEAIGSVSVMRESISRRNILRLWAAVAVICTISTVVGYGIANITGGNLRAAIDGFAAGALLVMLIDSMIPEATKESGRVAGLVTTLGFAVALWLSSIS
jgi:zinc transporter, ZIP family